MVLRGGSMNLNMCRTHQIDPINFLFRKSKVYSCPVTQKKIELDSDILKWFSRGRKKKKWISLYNLQRGKSRKIKQNRLIWHIFPLQTPRKQLQNVGITSKKFLSTRILVYFGLVCSKSGLDQLPSSGIDFY